MKIVITSTFVVIASAFALAGCSKSSGDTTLTSGATSAQGGASAACVDKLASLKPDTSADDKKAFAAACGAISAKAQACIAGAKTSKDIDACVVDHDKEAFMGAMFSAMKTPGDSPDKVAAPTKIAKLGLQIDVPGEVLVSDGVGPKSVIVNSGSIGGLMVSEATSSTAKTLKAAKSEAQMFKPKNVAGEQSSDGYWLTFENTGSLGTNYWVKTLHKVGAKTYVCEGSPDSAEKGTAIVAACKTLRSAS